MSISNLLIPNNYSIYSGSLNTGPISAPSASLTTELTMPLTGIIKIGAPTGIPAGCTIAVRGTGLPTSQNTIYSQQNSASASFCVRENSPCYIGSHTFHSFGLISNNTFALTCDTSQNVSIVGKLIYNSSNQYSVLAGTSSTVTRAVANYTQGMTDTLYYNPASGTPHTLTYRISTQMIARGGGFTLNLVTDNSTYDETINPTIEVYNEVGGAPVARILSYSSVPPNQIQYTSSQALFAGSSLPFKSIRFLFLNGATQYVVCHPDFTMGV